MPDNVDSMIVTALSGILPVWNVIKEKVDEEPAETYYAFNYSTHGTGYADDEPTGEVSMVQVHLIAPLNVNVSGLVKQTKQALYNAGFTWPQVTDASDDKGRHKVFEFQHVEGVDL